MVNRKAGPLDMAVCDQCDALSALDEAERMLRHAYHDVKVAEARLRSANQRMDGVAMGKVPA